MGRELKRVALDFKWPLNKVWKGFDNPHYDGCSNCTVCGGLGMSEWALHIHKQWYGQVPFHPSDVGLPPITADSVILIEQAQRKTEQSPEYYGTGPAAVRREAERLAALFNSYKKNHLTQAEIDVLFEAGGLDNVRMVRRPDGSWFERDGTISTDVYTSTAICTHHDPMYGALLTDLEKSKGSSQLCEACDGEGSVWNSPEAKRLAEEWEPTEPPEGDGWQLWETVSEGSPVSPVFKTAEELADWLAGSESSEREGVNRNTTRDQWLAFLNGPRWAPSMIVAGGRLMGGVAGVL